ncbi:MAG TPA: NAD(P)-binding domain-containing protein, partial [Mycobacterium sp.]
MIGIVGVGDMGLPMAGHMVTGGLEVLAYDVDSDRLAAAAENGAKAAAGLADVAEQADIVIACLRTDDQMHAVAEELVSR